MGNIFSGFNGNLLFTNGIALVINLVNKFIYY